MKNILKEFQSKTDITIETDDSLITYIKEFFKSNNTELISIDTQGDQVNLALRVILESDEETLQNKRQEAKQ